ncbi:MAG: acyl-CoA dehydrogenase family protein [Burkholderiales bacterium]|nr:acyl-CoA dehydrogenase family protein [Burkholderiales bacterium]
MSEPDAGSDLAAVRTRAVRVPGGWSLTGRKVWTTLAHRNHYAIVLARTGDAQGDRHAGLSQFIVDLRAPGVEVRPIVNVAGAHELNEVVFGRAFVPESRLVGKPGAGWAQVTSELAFERSGPERYLSSLRLAEAALACAATDGLASPRLAFLLDCAALDAGRAIESGCATPAVRRTARSALRAGTHSRVAGSICCAGATASSHCGAESSPAPSGSAIGRSPRKASGAP